jgi:tetratricopeptide (TPR) repeat protein
MANDSTSRGFAGFIEKIKLWGAPFALGALFVFGLRKGFKEVEEDIGWAVISVVSVAWLFLFWVYTSKKEREVWEGVDQQPKIEKVHLYPEWHKWAFSGMILLPILTLCGFAVANYIERRPSNKTIILIANFEGPSQKAVTQIVINRMKRATAQFPEVEVKPLDEVIKEGTDREEVSKIGAKHRASIVVRGFYDDALNVTAHIDQVRRTSSFTLSRNEMDFDVNLSEGRGITVQEALSGDMSLLILLIIGVARYDIGDYEGATQRFTTALDQRYSSQSENEADDVKFYLGKSLYRKGRYNEAVDKLQNVASKRGDDPDVLSWLGAALRNAGRYAEAEPLHKRALEIWEKAPSKDHTDTVRSLGNLASLYSDQGKYAEAEPLYKRALEIAEKALGKDHYYTGANLNNLANLYSDQGKYAEAEPLYKRALEIAEKTLGKDHPDTATSLDNLAGLYRVQKKYAEAEPLYKRALGIREKALGKDHPNTATSLNNLALLFHDQGKYAEAEPLYKRALEIREKALGKDHPATVRLLQRYVDLLYKMKRDEEATKLAARATGGRKKSTRK